MVYISTSRIYERVSFWNERYSRGGYSVPLEYLAMKGEFNEKKPGERRNGGKDVRSDYWAYEKYFLIKEEARGFFYV